MFIRREEGWLDEVLFSGERLAVAERRRGSVPGTEANSMLTYRAKGLKIVVLSLPVIPIQTRRN